jgi:acetylornithine deacetylase/succinyl-diaminopimelate desuccinylase-like protein
VQLTADVLSSDASPLRKDVIDAVARAVHRFYPGVPITPQQSSGATDGLIFRAAGIPTYGVDFVFIRDKDSFAHGLNERVPVSSFYNSLEQWYLVIKDLSGGRRR